MKFDFFYRGKSSKLHENFFLFPKQLLTDEQFSSLSSDAKLVYMLLLDRVSLSFKNAKEGKWCDKAGRLYIIFRHNDLEEMTHFSSSKCTRLLNALEDYGLIVRKKQGLGKPNLIYVKNVQSQIDELDDASAEMAEHIPTDRSMSSGSLASPEVSVPTSPEVSILTSPEEPILTSPEEPILSLPEVSSLSPPISKTKLSQTDVSHPPSASVHTCGSASGSSDIHEKEEFTPEFLTLREVQRIAEECSSSTRSLKIGGMSVPPSELSARFSQVTQDDIRSVVALIRSRPTVRNRQAYIRTALWNEVARRQGGSTRVHQSDSNSFCQFEQRDIDYDMLARELQRLG